MFPRAYLTRIGLDKQVQRNQIANYAFVEWPDNVRISASSPAEYFPPLFEELSPQEQDQARFWHALPQGWEHMNYVDFLKQRRVLIAEAIRAAFERLRSGNIPAEEPVNPYFDRPVWSVEDLLAEMETERVEFKSSAYYSYQPGIPERVVTDSVLKTVAGFLNANGGTLAIGIADNGEILGIQPDLDRKNWDGDRYVNSLTSTIGHSLGTLAATMVNIQLQSVDGVDVALVHVPPSTEPVYAKVSNRDQDFYVRVNNSTRTLTGPDLVGYVNQRWA
ncbi:MAG: hypothetical protein F4Z80_00685 [Chloroflexi bacterium]|nr:hypothetical protein [Chloroflexota bacterium]